MRDDAVDAAWTLDQCGSVLTQTGVDLLDQQCDARPRRTKSARHPFVTGFQRVHSTPITNIWAPICLLSIVVHLPDGAKIGGWVVWHGK